MNEFQLQCIETRELEILRAQIVAELKRRQTPAMIQRRIKNAKNHEENEILSLCDINKEIMHRNSSGFFYPPKFKKSKLGQISKYLDCLLNQDWSELFKGGSQDKKYYVYAHVDPRKRFFSATKSCGGNYGGMPFYIGKGTGDRAYDLKRNQGHGKMIRSITESGIGSDSIVKIIFNNLTESQAFEIESKLIFFFGTVYQEDRKYGILYNLDIPSVPIFQGEMESFVVKPQFRQKKGGGIILTKGQKLIHGVSLSRNLP